MPTSSLSPAAVGNSEAISAQAQRKERKRKHDREAQRQTRERTKARLKELEGLVKTLQAANECPERINDLLAQLQHVRDVNTKLRERMRKASELLALDIASESEGTTRKQDTQNSPKQPIERRFSTCDQDSIQQSATQDLGLHNPPTNCTDDFATFDSFEEMSTLNTQPLDPSTELQPYQYPMANLELHSLLHEQDVPSVTSNAGLGPVKSAGSETCSGDDPVVAIANTVLRNPGLEGRFWLLAGIVLSYVLSMPEQILTPRPLDDDIVIRSTIEGWDSVSQMYWLDAGWRWLRTLDEHMYSHLSSPVRMAIMRTMRMQYLLQRQPKRAETLGLPNFMKATPAQKNLPHEKLIEHYVWPGLRNHVLYSRERYTTNKFMEPFRRHLKFAWPHGPRETYELDVKRELYSFTPLYLEHQSHLECWQLDPDMFNLFPELRADIPASTPSPQKFLDFGLADMEAIEAQQEEDTYASPFQQRGVGGASNSAFLFPRAIEA